MDPIIGEIRMFAGDYAPVGWAFCDGTVLNVFDNDALFMLLGNAYGGDGYSTFALPDMRGRVPVHVGAGTDKSPLTITLGQKFGGEGVKLTPAMLPAHTHDFRAITIASTNNDPKGLMLSKSDGTHANYVTNAVPAKEHDTDPDKPLPAAAAMNPSSITLTGKADPTPLSVMQPYNTINYIIATQGIFPSRDN